MRDRPWHDRTTERPSRLRLIRIEEKDGGPTWGAILVDDIVVRAPFERFRGASLETMLEWVLYEGHRMIGVAIGEFARASGADG